MDTVSTEKKLKAPVQPEIILPPSAKRTIHHKEWNWDGEKLGSGVLTKGLGIAPFWF